MDFCLGFGLHICVKSFGGSDQSRLKVSNFQFLCIVVTRPIAFDLVLNNLLILGSHFTIFVFKFVDTFF